MINLMVIGAALIITPGLVPRHSDQTVSQQEDTAMRPQYKTQSVKIFYSYSHKDEEYLHHLIDHLKILKRTGIIDDWSDADIEAGAEFDLEIRGKLDSASIILLLISSHFIASDYAWGKEMKRAMQ
jgi:hypothetical protein